MIAKDSFVEFPGMRLIVLLFFELGRFKQLLRIFSTGHKDTQQQSQTAEPAKIF